MKKQISSLKKSLVLPSILLSGLITSCGDMTVCDCIHMYDEADKIHPYEVPDFKNDNEAKYDECKALVKKLGPEEWASQYDKCN